jgi:rubrerythrin
MPDEIPKKGGWQSSLMICAKCGYKWAAAHPSNLEYLGCPICKHLNPAPYIDPETGEVTF